MDVSLTPELEQFVEEQVANGGYASASDVVLAALRVLQDEERWKVYAREKIARGQEDFAAGRFVTKDQLLARLAERKRKRA